MEIEGALEDAFRKHVEVLTVETGPRTAFHGDNLAQAERYIREVFVISGPGVTEQAYRYRGQLRWPYDPRAEEITLAPGIRYKDTPHTNVRLPRLPFRHMDVF